MKLRSSIPLIITLVLLMLASLPSRATAHGTKQIGKYNVLVGWWKEPAYLNQPNTIFVYVTELTGDPAKPSTLKTKGITGLEKTLNIDVSFGGSDKGVHALVVGERDGLYTTSFMPTEQGRYDFRVRGTIDSLAVDDVFLSENTAPGLNDTNTQSTVVNTSVILLLPVIGLGLLFVFWRRKPRTHLNDSQSKNANDEVTLS